MAAGNKNYGEISERNCSLHQHTICSQHHKLSPMQQAKLLKAETTSAAIVGVAGGEYKVAEPSASEVAYFADTEGISKCHRCLPHCTLHSNIVPCSADSWCEHCTDCILFLSFFLSLFFLTNPQFMSLISTTMLWLPIKSNSPKTSVCVARALFHVGLVASNRI